jgi:GGDEF domain-containing protein
VPRSVKGDRYYWITAYLSARDLKAITCRLQAAMIAGLGGVPIVLLAGPVQTADPIHVAIAAAVAACCIAMASLWLRSSWPARWQSHTCVIVGASCIGVVTATSSDPAIGLVGCAGYTVLSAYATCFHSPRLLYLTWAIGLGALAVLTGRLIDTQPALALASVAVCALTNIFVAFACSILINLIARDDYPGDIDPLTGLLTREAFYDRVATLIHARSRDDDRYLAVLAVGLDGYPVLAATSSADQIRRARVDLAHALNATVRSTAILAHNGDTEFLIADLFATADASPLADRLAHCVATLPYRLTASIGAVTTPLQPLTGPSPVTVCDELVTLASMAMYDARRAGGNQTHYDIRPQLSALDGPPPHQAPDHDEG